VTDREALEREVASLREMLAAVPALVLRTDAELRILDLGRPPPGYPREALLGKHLFDVTPPALLDVARRICDAARCTGAPQSVAATVDGATWESTVTPLPSGDLLHVVRDVTHERAQALKLAQSEEALKLAKEASGVGLWLFDSRTGQVTWDEGMFRICGTPEPLDIEQWLEHVPEDDRARVRQGMEATLRSGSMRGATHRFLRPDGQLRWVTTVGCSRSTGEGHFQLMGCTVDVTEQQRAEERLREMQRLESIGQLAAGVAHNFNNLLAVILPAIELAKSEVHGTLQGSLEDASVAAVRAAELVRQLMTFARRRTAEPRRRERASVVGERAAHLCRQLFGALRVEVDDRAGDARIEGDLADLEQALINLLLNARDAVHAAGRARPRIALVLDVVPKEQLPVEGLEPSNRSAARWVRISVVDNGVGMTPDQRRRIFEPFFTTKEPGRGTGLGLATARAAVRDAGGDVTCTTTPGEGTRFDVWLPVVDGPERETDAAPKETRGNGEEVLVVDDEAAVRRAVARTLELRGFTALVAATAEEAIDLAKHHPAIAAALVDHAMPGASGARVISHLRQLLPRARLILFTGEDVDDEEARLADGVVQKPVSGAALAAALLGRS
jgi:PAS domain S-box-containing protein